VIVLVLDLGVTPAGDDATEEAVGAGRRHRSCIIRRRITREGDKPRMGTCPKCKLRIRKNGNHVKLGTVWYHKSCPVTRAAKSKKP
jgi:hypothetical protein